MQNFARTQEIMSIASNSAGASQEQFGKTLESMESKLNKLSNAWNTFLMGISNNVIIKAAIDLLTGVLNIINKITGKLPGLLKSIVNLGLAIGGLKLGKNILIGFAASFQKQLKDAGTKGATSLFSSFSAGVKKLFSTSVILNDEELITEYEQEAINKKITDEKLKQTSIESQQLILGKLKNKVSLKELIIAKLAEIYDRLRNSRLVQTIGLQKLLNAETAKQKALQLGIVGAIVAGVAALTIGIVALVNAINDASLESQLERAKETTDRMKEAASSAAEEYDNLLADKDEYNELQNTLEELVVGTDEWKQKLIEANNKVIELIGNYAELAQYIDTGENGELTIKAEGWDKVIEAQQKAVENTTAAQLLSQANEADLQGKIVARDQILANSRLMASEKTPFYDNTNLKQEYENEAIKRSNEQRSYEMQEKSLRSSIYAQTTAYATSELGKEIANLMSDYNPYDETNIRNKYQRGNNYANATYYDENGNAVQRTVGENYKALAKQYLGKESFTRDEKSMRELYSAMSGTAVEDLEDWSKKELEIAIGQLDEASTATAKFTKIMNAVTAKEKDYGDVIKGLSGSGSLTKNQVKDINADNVQNEYIEGIIKGIADEAEMDLNELLTQLGFDSIEEAADQYRENIKANQEAWDKANNDVVEKNGGESATQVTKLINQIDNDLASSGRATLDQYKSYLDQISTMIGANGVEAAEQFNASFMGILSQASEEQQQQILNSLDGYDFTDLSSVDDFIENIKEIGGVSNASLMELRKQLIDLGIAARKVDLNTLINNFTSLLDMADEFASAEKNGISTEDYESLVKIMPDVQYDFVFDGQEWIYTEGTMQDLAVAIRENTAAIMKDTENKLAEDIALGEAISAKVEEADVEEKFGTGANAKTFTDLLTGEVGDEYINAISAFMKSVFDGVANDLDELTNEEMYQRYQEYMSAYNNLEANKATQINYNNQVAGASAYQQTTNPVGNVKINITSVDGNALDNYNKLLDTTIRETAHLTEEVEIQTKTFKALGFSTKTAELKAKELVIQEDKLEDKIDNVRKAVGDQIDVLDDASSSEEALSNSYFTIAKAASDLFGTTVDESFVKDNIDLFRELEQGGTEAYQQLANNLSLSMISALNDVDGTMTNVFNQLIALDSSSFTVDGFLDLTSFLESLNIGKEKAKEFIDLIGSLPGWEVVTVVNEDVLNLDWSNAGKIAENMTKLNGKSIVHTEVRQLGNSSTFGTTGGGGYTPSGGGGDSEKVTAQEKAYDRLYNLSQEINASLREREKLERQYNRLLESEDVTGKKLIENQLKQRANLKQTLAQQQKMLEERQKEADNAANDITYREDGDGNSYATTWRNLGVEQYAWIDEITGKVQINWEKYNSLDPLSQQDSISVVEDWIKYLEDKVSNIEDAQDSVDETTDALLEIEKESKQDYLDFEDRIYEAVVKQYQEQIDQYQELSDTIDETNNNILEAVQESIDLERQIRDNTKKEEDIADKESQLAYLQRDTSGANQLEILKLQEEIDDARQDYTDQLIDQKIEELKNQNDKASEQREKQIEIMQAQLDRDEKNGVFWENVQAIIGGAFEENGELKLTSPLVDLLKNTDAFKGMSEFGQADWMTKLAAEVAAAMLGQSNWKVNQAKKDNTSKSNSIKATGTNGNANIWWDKTSGNFVDKNGNIYNNVSYDYTTGQYTYDSITQKKKAKSPKQQTPTTPSPTTNSNQLTDDIAKGVATTICLGDNAGNWGNFLERYNKITEKFGAGAYDLIQGYVDNIVYSNWENIYCKERNAYAYSRFKTGGLADFTGPAWLDGTKASPELVLNSQDTQNFITLKNILADLLNKGVKDNKQQTSGDNYFDININVDELASDYDVDQLAEQVKEQIYQDASYKNVNVINRLR